VRHAAVFLLVVGLMQMTGDLLGVRALRGIGAATAASPAPKVFTAWNGFETFTNRFFVEWTDISGQPHSLEVTSELYSHLRGPYNRRNVYGAALAYGPVMPAALRDPVMTFALCGRAPLLHELGVDPATVGGGLRVRYEPRLPGPSGPWPSVLEADCR
jgi:hypothetical protein